MFPFERLLAYLFFMGRLIPRSFLGQAQIERECFARADAVTRRDQ
jgi:hypothetical protein